MASGKKCKYEYCGKITSGFSTFCSPACGSYYSGKCPKCRTFTCKNTECRAIGARWKKELTCPKCKLVACKKLVSIESDEYCCLDHKYYHHKYKCAGCNQYKAHCTDLVCHMRGLRKIAETT